MKTKLALVGTLAVAVASFAPVTIAGAQDESPASESGSKTVIESETGSYIVVMAADPLITTIASEDLGSPEAEAQAAVLEESHDEVLADAGIDTADKVQDYTNSLNGFSALLSHDEATELAANPKVALVLPDEMRFATTDSSGEYLGLTQRGGAYRSGLTGEGVVVGIIDTGIWPEHPSFADDGTYADPAFRPPCEFGDTAHNPNDVAFTCQNKLIGARQMLNTYRAVIGAAPDEFNSARDDNGHGTHTASTAAGNADLDAEIFGRHVGTISGIAPRAQIIAYKGLGNLGGFTSDLAAAIDTAVLDGVDVINYSIGGGPGLVGGDAISFLFASALDNVWIATSAGNSGPGDATIGGPADNPWLTTVGANTQDRFFEGEVELGRQSSHWGWGWGWGHSKHRNQKVTGASITRGTRELPLVDAEFAGGDLCIPGTLDPVIVTDKIVLCRRGAIGRADKSLAVFQAGGAGMILYNAIDTDNLFTDRHWVPSVHIDLTPGLKVKEYIAETKKPTADIDTGDTTSIKYDPSMTIFSSRGPNPSAGDVIKPDITAPGLQILAGNSPFGDLPPTSGATPDGDLFQAIAGTSMSSPHVAGFYALLRQAHPDWTAAMAKSAIMTTADPDVADNDRKSDATPFGQGSGLLDPGKVNRKGSAFNPGLVYNAGFNDYLAFMCDAAPEVFANPTATCAALVGLGFSTDPSDLNYPSIGIADLAGTQTITRTVTSVADKTVKWKVHVHAPKGFEVAVQPHEITLAPGASATYEVTITSKGTVPIGQWSFGDLTWKGGGYDARSPIGVRGAAIDAPAEVSGTGVAGSVSFDVKFGYTGPYTAVPQGLVAEVITAGDISQDPDQTYPSADDGVGVDLIPFDLTGAAFVRWELIIPGAPDIDLYLLDPAGNIVAASTSGGTDELIDFEVPEGGGVYTMVVHGWAVPVATPILPYELSSWMVPAASGGSLSVTAPTEAVNATTATVTASWSGLATGTRYLGSVAHVGPEGLLARTLVSVQT